MNFYAILGIPYDADDEAIRSAYRTLARRYHPDIGAGSSTEKFRQVSEAYETLIDPRRRQLYDVECRRTRDSSRPVEPITAPPEPLGGFPRRPFVNGPFVNRPTYIDDLFDELLRAFDDLGFFRSPWRR